MNRLKKRLGENYIFTVAGPGRTGRFPSFISDQRIRIFDEKSEKQLCSIYAASILVFGVHGSGMLLPSAHAGMAITLMPSKRWGNFAEDILFSEKDVRIASFQRRVIPLNISIYDLIDIVVEMVTGRNSFLKKFIHSDDL
jgi:hypothetical protein